MTYRPTWNDACHAYTVAFRAVHGFLPSIGLTSHLTVRQLLDDTRTLTVRRIEKGYGFDHR